MDKVYIQLKPIGALPVGTRWSLPDGFWETYYPDGYSAGSISFNKRNIILFPDYFQEEDTSTPKMGQRYWFIDLGFLGIIVRGTDWYDSGQDKTLKESNNFFLTESEANDMKDKIEELFKGRKV